MTIHYTIKPVHPEAHLFEVTLLVCQPDPAGQCFSMPNWIPGSYMIRDFARNIVQLNATASGQAVVLEKLGKSLWRAPENLSELMLKYRIYAWDLSVRAAHLDKLHAFFNGSSVFLSVDGQENSQVTVEIKAADGDAYKTWRVATTLPSKKTDKAGFGIYKAENYAELIDHPVEMGTFERVVFTACGVTHELVLTGYYRTDTDRIVADLARICEHHIRFFGEPAPVNTYCFLVTVVAKGYGGLEHRASTALLISRDNLPVPGDNEISDSYLQFLGLCSHEYFHTWNVKRLKPARFVPYQLQAESYTRLLWFFEGITSYYDDLALVRCGLITDDRYLSLLSKTITRVYRGSGRLLQTVTDSSFDAWHKFYKQDENAPNAIVSYYTKGSLIALCLDAELRKTSQGGQDLDKLMVTMWRQWLVDGEGLAETQPEAVAAELAGTSLDRFFNGALYSTAELPLDDALNTLGITLAWRRRNSVTDTGGATQLVAGEGNKTAISTTGQQARPGSADDCAGDLTRATSPWFGANLAEHSAGARITHVFSSSAAEKAGLAAGDVVIALDRVSVVADKVDEYLQRYAGEASVSVHYFRHGLLAEAELPVQAAVADTSNLCITNRQLAENWLGSSHDE